MRKIIALTFILFFIASASFKAQTVYITDRGKKYHAKNCRIVKNGKKEISLVDAKTKGYKACKICKIEDLIAAEEKEKQEKEAKNKK